MNNLFCPFPKDFLWGAATAAFQIEGAASEDGRTPSVWDTLCRRPGAIASDHTGERATDHYHRYKEDVGLMKSLGLKAYRFSTSWSRIFPDDSGKPNPRGVDFYSRLIDELLHANIQPWLTLFHWDLPQWCEDKWRGWEGIDCANAFADYVSFMARKFGDRVKGFMTMNEFWCFLDQTYAGEFAFAPAKTAPRQVINQAKHHAVYAHGLAVQAIRAACGAKCPPVGLAENIPNIVPVLETPQDIAAAKEALRDMSGMFLTPIFEGAYHPEYLQREGANAPVFTDEEMRVISTPVDFLGINLYAPTYIRHDPSNPKGWSQLPCGDDYPRMHMPWLFIGPAILYWGPRLVSEVWKIPAVYVTENGCAYPDKPTEKNEILDLGRMMYLQNHLIHLHRAVAEGYPMKGYFIWSLLDNFEWTSGYTKRFGIHYVNYETFHRTPKLSAQFYKQVIQRNAIGGTG
jgi:beta-glucosidase